jgi:hypothetical protein
VDPETRELGWGDENVHIPPCVRKAFKEGREMKPKVRLTGKDGNVFNIIGLVSRALKNAGMAKEAAEFRTKAFGAGSYDEVLQLAMDYAEVS